MKRLVSIRNSPPGSLVPTSFRPYHPGQPHLLPPDPREWLPDDHLAYQISDLVDSLDLTAFYAPYEGDGRRNSPYEPAMMAKLLLYGYATGVFSSRRIERRLDEDVAFRFLAAGNLPRHRTICEFRRRHLEDFGGLFVQVVAIARELGLARLGTLAVDSSRVKASASKRKAMTYGRMLAEEQRLREEVARLLDRAEAIDRAEDEEYGPANRGDELPAELRRRSDRLKAIAAAKRRLEAKARRADDDRGRKPGQVRNPRGGGPYKRAYGEPDPKAQHNFTDPESCIMNTSTEGFQQAYNAQAAVDSESRLIVAADVSASASDAGQLLPMVGQAAQNAGRRPDTVLADAGYASERDLVALELAGMDGYVSLGREGKAGRSLRTPARKRMAARLATAEGRRRYAARKHIAEPPFGWIKQVLGFRRFSVRGLAKVRGEWALVCLSLNARRLNVPPA
jgi:transposase